MRYEDMEFLNFRNILDSIGGEEPATRASIAKKLGLSRTTVSNVVNMLISNGIVVEYEASRTSRGRPGLVLGFSKDTYKVIGASFLSNTWFFVITTLQGDIVEEYSTPEIDNLTPETLIQTLIAGLRFLLSRKEYSFVPAVGLGLPGIIDTDKGNIIVANDLGWHNRVDVSPEVEKELGIKVYCINRYTASGLAEYQYVCHGKEKDFIYIGIGSGIRSAIFSNGHLLEGSQYTAGRIAHLTIDPDGELCDCGRRGCLLAYANDRALIQKVLQLRQEQQFSKSLLAAIPGCDITVEAIADLADRGDLCSQKALDAIAGPVAKAIAMLADIINPSKIIIGGPIGYSSMYLTQKVRELYARLAGPDSLATNFSIEQGQLRTVGSALGAASLVVSNRAELLFNIL